MKKRFKINKTLISSLLSLLVLSVFSCDDIVEEDLANDLVVTITPSSGQVITSNAVSFQWNNLEGADDYRVQIENNTNVVILDSVVSTTTLEYPLNPGAFKWRVRGENFAYHTAYTFPIAFSVEASNDLTNQTVFLNTPTNNYYTNSGNGIITTWASINSADSYTFELEKRLSGNTTTLYQEAGITATTYTIDGSYLNEDAAYIWKVKALNTTTMTETIYASRSILFDSTVPNVPGLLSPANNATAVVNTNVVFNWDSGTDPGNINAPLTHLLEIATNTNFSNAEVYSTTTLTQGITFVVTGDYYWRVKTRDQAGNESAYSGYNKITVN
ncbi:hypothetical protein [Lacinutrix sp. Hel_I_90]|uniref:hypothetical protein n=1 Tax=Lacinutrix sp. Hel_I_90 TaxID=1249999 RepID=UPI0005C902D5|nr:hypothetical protein [Lacinutrix sp. Hel_I_90]